MQSQKISYLDQLTYFSIFSLALFSYTSTTLSALSHIFILVPGGYFFYRAIREGEFKLSASQWALMGMIILGILSIVIAPDIERKFHRILKIKYLLLGLLSVFAYRHALKSHIDNKKIKILINVFLVTVSLASISGAIGLFTGYNPLRFRTALEPIRSTGMYGMAVTYGYGMQFVVILLTGLWINRDKIKDYIDSRLLTIAWIVSIVGIVLSYTRGAILGVIIAIPFLFYRKSKKVFWSLIAIGVVAIVALVLAINFRMLGKHRLFQGLKSDSNMMRISQYQAAWQGFLEKPLTGLGFRNFERHSIRLKEKHDLAYKDFGGHAHNNFIEFMVGTGIFGLVAIVLFHGFWFVESFGRKDLLGPIFSSSVVALIVSGQVQCTMSDGENMFVIMFFYAISQATLNRAKEA